MPSSEGRTEKMSTLGTGDRMVPDPDEQRRIDERNAALLAAETAKRSADAPTGVRWQAQMEDHLEAVRRYGSDMSLQSPSGLAQGHAAQAHAIAALALAVANAGSDLEGAITNVYHAVSEGL